MKNKPEQQINILQQENQKLKLELEVLKGSVQKKMVEINEFSNLFMQLTVGIVILDGNFIIQKVNHKLCEIFNTTSSFIEGVNIGELRKDDILTHFMQTERGVEGFFEGNYTTLQGFTVYISVEVKPFSFQKNGKIHFGGIGVVHDITENKLAENAVNKSFDTFQTVLVNLDAVVYTVDAKNHEILFMNRRAEEVLGGSIGDTCWKTFFPKQRTPCKHCSLHNQNIKNRTLGKLYNHEEHLHAPEKWLKYSDCFIEWIDGRKALLVTTTDITTIKKSGQLIEQQNIELALKKAELEKLLKNSIEQYQQIDYQAKKLVNEGVTKDKMFSIIGHDLRGPVGNIKNLLDLIIDDYEMYSKEEILSFIDPVRHSAGSAFSLLENLLYWSKSQSGKIEFIPHMISINEIIEDSISLVAASRQSKKITLFFDNKNDFYIQADENMLHAILRNLLGNALKFTPAEGNIYISTSSLVINNIEHIQIIVKDTGLGISPENLLKIFDKNIHFTTYGTNNEKGSGLGLILSEEFARKHNGFISVESNLGKGSTFTVSLPQGQHTAISKN